MVEEKPKRVRGAKILEEGYRAGFHDGHRQGLIDARSAAEEDEKRERLMRAQLEQLRAAQAKRPKRTRKAKAIDHRTDEQKLRDLAQERAT